MLTHPETGTPQGGVISPPGQRLPALGAGRMVREDGQPRLKGRASLIRYADDAVLVFELEDDARRVMEVLPKRFGKYGLTLHPEKTRLVPFQGLRRGPDRAPATTPRHVRLPGVHPLLGPDAQGELGGKAQDGQDRLRRSLVSMAEWCREHRHVPITEQWAA